MSSRQLDEEAVFHVARGIPDHETRSKYLDQICEGDLNLRSRVDELLKVHVQEDDFLKSYPDPGPTEEQPPISEGPGHRIGRYKLLQKIGEGGFGVVYMAEQQKPVRRKVALKIIKPGMDTHAVIARFEAERQALALMDSPNISRVLDGGTTDSERPYFVMELVRGVPITEYCDKNELSTNARLELFVTVCQAVQHAHQKGIIHRDLKPSNILVTLHDGKPVVKVIDFGVAKAINQQLTERTLFTAYGQMVGTPQYMSPEQAEMSGLDVDTRSDIYSLGVLLYELLTGTTPLEAELLRTAGYAEMQRLIREEEPPKPSTRLSGSGERLTVIAKHRHATPDRLHKLVRGDLDWIVMKALDKDRSRRYETAKDFAADVDRHFKDEPIEARPPSRVYQLRKYARRNKVPVAAAVVVTLTLLVASVINIFVSARLLAARQKLQEAFIYQAIVEAMAVDEDAMEEAITEATRAGASSTWKNMLQALLADHGGRPEEAIPLLKEVCNQEPENTAARAMLATAYFNAGKADEHEREVRILNELKPKDDFDILFKASTEATWWNTGPALADLRGLVERRTSWELAHVMLAKAKVYNAWDTGRWEEAADAARMISTTKLRLPDLLSVYSVELMANIAAKQLAPKDVATAEGWQEKADLAANVLEEKFSGAAFRELTIYHYICSGNADQAIAVLDEACKVGGRSIPNSFRNGMLLGEQRYGEMEGDSGKPHPFAALELHDDPQEVAGICRAYLEGHDTVTVRSVWPRIVLCACGEREEALQQWGRMLDNNENILWNLEYSMMVLTGRWSSDDALDEAGVSRIKRSLVHFAIAMRHLYIAGDPEAAREHFQQCVNYEFIDVDYYYWAKAFLARLDDPTWPRWLPQEERK